MSIKKAIQDINAELDRFHDSARQVMEQELLFIAADMRELAPLGTSGALQKSFQVKISLSTIEDVYTIESNLDYASYQADNELMHVPKGEIGKKSFKQWGTTKNYKQRKSGTSKQQIKYQRGYRHAVKEDLGQVYQQNFVELAIELNGGELGIIKAIEQRLK